MFIVCRTCSSSYHIPDEILGDEACQFRCTACGRSWELRRRATLDAPAASTRGGGPSLQRAPAPPRVPARRLTEVVGKLAPPLAAAAVLAASMSAIGAREAIVAAVP